MSSKIDGLGQRPVAVSSSDRSRRAGSSTDPGSGAGNAPAADKVTLTDSARQLQRLSDAVASASGFDGARVAALKDAIARGEYQPDAGRIATQLIALERGLVGR